MWLFLCLFVKETFFLATLLGKFRQLFISSSPPQNSVKLHNTHRKTLDLVSISLIIQKACVRFVKTIDQSAMRRQMLLIFSLSSVLKFACRSAMPRSRSDSDRQTFTYLLLSCHRVLNTNRWICPFLKLIDELCELSSKIQVPYRGYIEIIPTQ